MELHSLLKRYRSQSQNWIELSSHNELPEIIPAQENMLASQREIAREVERWLRERLGNDFGLILHALDLSVRRNRKRRRIYVQDALDFIASARVTGDFKRALDDIRAASDLYGEGLLVGESVPLPAGLAGVNFADFSDVLTLAIGNTSSGSSALIDQFTKIYNAVLSRPDGAHSLLLLIDEGDAYLHFEWQQKYIKFLDEFVRQMRPKFSSVQVVLATHSPILMTDVPSDNVIRVGDDRGAVCTFGAPLERVVNTTGEAGSIGEFAAEKIVGMLNGAAYLDQYLVEQIDDGFVRSELGRVMLRDRARG